jgi:predicted membrane protein
MVVLSIYCYSTFQVRLQLWSMAATLLHTVHIQVISWWDTIFSIIYVDTVIILTVIFFFNFIKSDKYMQSAVI